MALILSRVITPDIASHINDIANQDWLQEKSKKLKEELFGYVIKSNQVNEPIEFNEFAMPDEVLKILRNIDMYSLIDSEIHTHLLEFIWVYHYVNKFNSGPWVIYEDRAFQEIYKILHLDERAVEELLEDI